MRERALARTLASLRGANHREWALLGAGLIVAGAVVASLLGFSSYEESYRATSADATIAELAASRVNGLQWQSLAEPDVAPGTGARVNALLGTIWHRLELAGPHTVVGRQALARYTPAIHREFALLTANRIPAARGVVRGQVDPAFGDLNHALGQVAAQNLRAANEADALTAAGAVVAVAVGFAGIAALLLRFGTARRALATAEVEQRLLLENDQIKNGLISIVSHDLRTPLTSVMGYLEMMADEEPGPLTQEQRRFLTIMQRNAGRLLAIVNDLLFISRARAGQIELSWEELSLEGAAAQAVDAQRPHAVKKGVSLSLAASPSPPVLADQHRVDELLENLLSNALKFTQPGGSVQVAVRPADGLVRLEVSDTGSGIAEKDQRRLFEQFFRSPDVSGTPGVGLGLSIVKAIADAHDAAIRVSSTLGAGTTFSVDFPATRGQPAGGSG